MPPSAALPYDAPRAVPLPLVAFAAVCAYVKVVVVGMFAIEKSPSNACPRVSLQGQVADGICEAGARGRERFGPLPERAGEGV